ncbi:MAG: hypothetical protein GWN18_12200, partial [Thermoplasmata archaeon]|nr:acetate--CoA ligase [Thermoplasmata archaeon]NIS20723.1 acetate--CoA ligase [Thermoplasmata archaeon]NIT78127.1 acetate--CoA ligase [Thermoplasmata archaeon]NIV79486.1 hypothetical protein [Thermoplasmata archaeon]NIW83297.1 hypothetical protein [Thermoplasmata archaeon]
MKETADHAIDLAGGMENVLVVEYTNRPDTPMTAGRDIWWHDALSGAQPIEAA